MLFFSAALPGMSLVAIHLSLNEPVPGTQPGKFNQDLEKSGDVFTTMVVADWKRGDTIHYWLYAIYEGLGRHKLMQQFVIDSGEFGTAECRQIWGSLSRGFRVFIVIFVIWTLALEIWMTIIGRSAYCFLFVVVVE